MNAYTIVVTLQDGSVETHSVECCPCDLECICSDLDDQSYLNDNPALNISVR